MWLWKKFWNTDIIGKIYILIILFIVIVATITIITRYKNANTNQVLNEQQNEVIQDAVLTEQNVIVGDTISVVEVEENIKDDIKTKEEKSVINTDKVEIKNTEQTESKEKTEVTENKGKTKENTSEMER